MGCIHTPNPFSDPCGACRARELEDELVAERKLRVAESDRAAKAEAEVETEREHRIRETARADRERTLRLETERDEAIRVSESLRSRANDERAKGFV